MSVSYPTTDIEYREIPRFLGYCFGVDGSVWSRWFKPAYRPGVLRTAWKQFSPKPHKRCGRVYVRLWIDGSSRFAFMAVHRLILEAFVGPCPPGIEACHFPDRNPTNNRVDNLRWDTPVANHADRVIHRTSHRAERNGNAKLTWEKAEEIRRLRRTGMTLEVISRKFGIASSNACNICRGRAWRNPC